MAVSLPRNASPARIDDVIPSHYSANYSYRPWGRSAAEVWENDTKILDTILSDEELNAQWPSLEELAADPSLEKRWEELLERSMAEKKKQKKAIKMGITLYPSTEEFHKSLRNVLFLDLNQTEDMSLSLM